MAKVLIKLEESLNALNRDLRGPAKRHITNAAAIRAVSAARSPISADLGGDTRFSGWKPKLELKVLNTRDNNAVIHPTKVSAGPWTVAQEGRNQGNVRGGVFLGPGATRAGGTVRRRKDGTVAKVRGRKGKRWNGVTRGKQTADDVVDVWERKLPGFIEDELLKVINKHLGG